MTDLLPDHLARQQALDIHGSYIVQAPAGSGKTELLTLRYLKLLAVCSEPEQVLAITFTRKAASEMRDRVISVLNWSQSCLDGTATASSTIEELRLKIATQVLQANTTRNWHLLENPSRLRVQTIDSFCFYLANQLPVLSQIGGNPTVTEDIAPVFREAAKKTLAQLESNSELADAIATVLRHLDNDVAAVEDQLIRLLYQRDQWSSYIRALTSNKSETREYFQQGLEELIEESLSDIKELLREHADTMIELANYAAHNKQKEDKLPDTVARHFPLQALPEAGASALPLWKFFLSFLLTKDGNWLKAANKNHGFPPGDKSNPEHQSLCKTLKEKRLALLTLLMDKSELLDSLNYLTLLPDPELDDKQWQFLVALCRVLQTLNVELLLAFRNFRVVDYTQAGAAALLALGESEQPTDLAMALDNVIQHILVDEFQDTSQLQLELLQKLTAGWQSGDGRSLFLVGDAMQSCYGFRNANVGIYLGVLEYGLGELSLEPLQLSSNFRSQRPMVEWVNDVFRSVFPQQANISRGAVPYSPAAIIHETKDSTGVSAEIIHYAAEDRLLAQMAEAENISQQILSLRSKFPTDSIAILVRTRSQLDRLIPALRSAGLSWTATDIDRLNSLPIISDLNNILRLILHPGDQLAWLALLRAPWCGLDTADLHTLCNNEEHESLWLSLLQHADLTALSAHAHTFLPGFTKVMEFILAMRCHESLRHCVEAAWTLLRGDRCYKNDLEKDSVDRFFQLLEEQETAGGLADYFRFEEILAEAFVPSPADTVEQAGLHLLTMHKAKGLEYDHVLLPGLNRSPRNDDKNLLIWHERLNHQQEQRLHLASVTETGSEDSPLYQLLRHEQKSKALLESARLLYIAITRAKKSVILSGILPRAKDGEVKDPESSTLLSRVWSELLEEDRINFTALEDFLLKQQIDQPRTKLQLPAITPIRRFTAPLQLNQSEEAVLNRQLIAAEPQEHASACDESDTKIQSKDHELQSLQGTLIHRCLEDFVQADNQSRYLQELEKLRSYWALSLRHLELSEVALESALSFIEESVRNTCSDPNLAWVFSHAQEDSQCEMELSRVGEQGFVKKYIVDRTFVDAEGTRWIIDYKSGSPGSAQTQEQFLAEQSNSYADQLRNYKSLFVEMENRPTRTALLLTAIPKLLELELA